MSLKTITSERGAKPAGAPASAAPNAEAQAVDPLARLLEMQTALGKGSTATGETAIPELAATEADPENGAPPEGYVPGEDDLPGEDGSADAEPNDHSQSETTEAESADGAEPEAALPPELATLPDDVRAQLLEMAADVAAGRANFGEIKRGYKDIGKHREQVQQLEQQITDLKSQLGNSPAAAMPEDVTRLTSLDAVQKREAQLNEVLDFCEDNPEGGAFGQQEFSREEVQAMRRNARQQLRSIPQRREQLQQQAQFVQQQTQVRPRVLAEFPELKDPENATTQAVSALLNAQPWMKQTFVSPELAALQWIAGEQALQARRKGAKPGVAAAKKPVAKPGAVPKGKPAVRNGAAPGRTNGVSVEQAKQRVANERSVEALAGLMSAMEPSN